MDLIDKQIGKITEQLKIALLSHIPIAYIPTNDMELIWDILYSQDTHNAIIPRTYYNPGTGETECLEHDKFFMLGNTGFNSITDNYWINPKNKSIKEINGRPFLIVFNMEDWEKTPSLVDEFIKCYIGYKRNGFYFKAEEIEWVRRSLCLITTPTYQPIPTQIAPYVKKIGIPRLCDEEIFEIVYDKISAVGYSISNLDDNFINQIVVSLRGLPKSKINSLFEEIIAKQYIAPRDINESGVIATVRAEKKAMMEDSPGLKWEKVGNATAAGLSEIIKYLNQREEIFKDPQKASQQYIDVPKGVLISGVPGSGKSLMAKTAARMLKLPLISLDMGAMLGSLMGQSEHNMIEALHMAEQMAPCVLWIDEIEKAFSGSSQNASSGDSGVGRRMFGKFLTWMQEKSSACFVFATSNDISSLPPELFRSERFDRKYFTFMPTAHECAEIFSSIIREENKKYREQHGIDEISLNISDSPYSLFSTDAEKTEFWIRILNQCCAKNDESLTLEPLENASSDGADTRALYWADNVKPKFKLMTGADISALVKDLKFILSQKKSDKYQIYDNCIYRANLIEYHATEIIRSDSFKPYGETNVIDIVKCFQKLYINQFVSASGSHILKFENYSDDDFLYIPKDESFDERYDQALHYMLVGAINKYSRDIHYERIK